MAISKIQLGNSTPQEVRDAKALHYIGHATAGITESAGTYTSSTTVTINGSAVTVAQYDYVTYGNDNLNLVCTSTNGTSGIECTWEKLTEKAAEIPVLGVTVNGTSVVNGTTKIAEISLATASTAATPKFGVVQTSNNITNTNGVISVPDATTAVKGVVQLADAVDETSATAATDVPTVSAVATAIAELPQAMIFKGTLDNNPEGSATIHALPTAAKQTAGDVYQVIEAATYSGTAAEVGDLFICAQGGTAQSPSYSWVLIPSGDVPAGTVTSIQAAAVANTGLILGTGVDGASGAPITSSGTITVGVANGYAIPETSDIENWDDTYEKVDPYTDATPLIDGLAVANSQSAGDGSVTVARMGTGNDADTLIIDFIKPTISATATNVVKPIPVPEP